MLSPDALAEPYDGCLGGCSPAAKREWATGVLGRIDAVLLGEPVDFELHAGRDYWGFGFRSGLADRGCRVVVPGEGLDQGRQLALYAAGDEDRRRVLNGSPGRV